MNKTFKPFDKVLVRDPDDITRWHPNFFEAEDNLGFYTIDGRVWSECIPYKGNELLCGTTNDPEGECTFKSKDIVAVTNNALTGWKVRVFKHSIDSGAGKEYVTYEGINTCSTWKYCNPVKTIFPEFGEEYEHTVS